MSTTTSHMSLIKYDLSDKISPTGYNQNFDAIDTAINELQGNYVVSSGTSNGWTWRTWSNGIAECWRTVDSTYSLSAWGNIGYAYFDLDLPALFSSKPSAHITCEGFGTLAYGGLWSSNSNTNVGSLRFYVASLIHTTGSYRVRSSIYMIGASA